MLEGFSYGAGGFSDARNISAASPCAGKGTPPETLDCLSHDTGGWTLYLLPRSRSERRADASSAARTSIFLADVRSSLRPAFRSLPPYRAGLSRLRAQRLARPEKVRVHIRSHSRNHESLYRSARTLAIHALYAGLRRARGFSHGPGSSGPSRGAHCSERCGTQRRFGSDPNVEGYAPDRWTDEFAFLSQPGQVDIQSDLFYDYRTNVDSYPKWQGWMRERRPRLLVIWGKYDPSFDLSEPEAYRRDVPNAELHIVDAGHFALDTRADEIAALVGQFMKRQK